MTDKLQLVIADSPRTGQWYWGIWIAEKSSMILFVEKMFETREACLENYTQVRQFLIDNPEIKLWRNTITHEITKI